MLFRYTLQYTLVKNNGFKGVLLGLDLKPQKEALENLKKQKGSL